MEAEERATQTGNEIMSGYSGTATIDFDIERYRNIMTGNLVHPDKVNDLNEFLYEYVTHTLTIEGRSYYQPGRLYGPPEDCYPDEGETEIMSVIGPDGKNWEDQLSDGEKELILELIQENVMDGCDGSDPDDYYDDYDRD